MWHRVRHTYGLNKLLWLREHRPTVYQELSYWLSVEDFVLWKLTGRFATNYSVASRTMAFDQRARTWSSEVLAHVDVPVGHLAGSAAQRQRSGDANTGSRSRHWP